MSLTARLDPCNLVVLQGDHWSERFPVDQLRAKIRFYRCLWAGVPPSAPDARLLTPGKHSRHYEGTLAALEAIAAEVGQSCASR
jgi:hypothetical protein